MNIAFRSCTSDEVLRLSTHKPAHPLDHRISHAPWARYMPLKFERLTLAQASLRRFNMPDTVRQALNDRNQPMRDFTAWLEALDANDLSAHLEEAGDRFEHLAAAWLATTPQFETLAQIVAERICSDPQLLGSLEYQAYIHGVPYQPDSSSPYCGGITARSLAQNHVNPKKLIDPSRRIIGSVLGPRMGNIGSHVQEGGALDAWAKCLRSKFLLDEVVSKAEDLLTRRHRGQRTQWNRG
ncbi:MAG TPA: hypothetical protein VF169_24995 [Albitalea sp.]|uniref:hypothetical protein n=1 Tax=Piscinibacter sp. TaxID=1903157 RepID=UPI002ED01324